VQNDGKLASDSNLGFAEPASLRKPDAPSFERRPLCYAGEQNIGCLVEIGIGAHRRLPAAILLRPDLPQVLSVSERLTDSNQTSRQVRKVPQADLRPLMLPTPGEPPTPN